MQLPAPLLLPKFFYNVAVISKDNRFTTHLQCLVLSTNPSSNTAQIVLCSNDPQTHPYPFLKRRRPISGTTKIPPKTQFVPVYPTHTHRPHPQVIPSPWVISFPLGQAPAYISLTDVLDVEVKEVQGIRDERGRLKGKKSLVKITKGYQMPLQEPTPSGDASRHVRLSDEGFQYILDACTSKGALGKDTSDSPKSSISTPISCAFLPLMAVWTPGEFLNPPGYIDKAPIHELDRGVPFDSSAEANDPETSFTRASRKATLQVPTQ
ncbi:hypothetical protein AX16_002676 [Volvariella volvacea WC 439]|nr:hypothetical protein AX16_002676 [Volvariella volvacea WC 439]